MNGPVISVSILLAQMDGPAIRAYALLLQPLGGNQPSANITKVGSDMASRLLTHLPQKVLRRKGSASNAEAVLQLPLPGR